MGQARALEVALGCRDFPAELAERYGWINRALPPNEITAFVESLARNIATYPTKAVARCKASIINTNDLSLYDGLIEESYLFDQLVILPEAKECMKRFKDAGGQTREGEEDLDRLFQSAKLS
jgi:enoyl-CoA hydratase/carnithine racemase